MPTLPNPYSDPGDDAPVVETDPFTRVADWLSDHMLACLGAIFGPASLLLWVLGVASGSPAHSIVPAVVAFAALASMLESTTAKAAESRRNRRAIAVVLWAYTAMLGVGSAFVAVFGS